MTIKYGHQKTLNEKKCQRLFNKNTPLYAGLDSKQISFKILAATKQLIRKISVGCLKNQAIFFTGRFFPILTFLTVLIKPFFLHDQKFEYLENKKSF